jgi:hypothetical protein
MENLKHTQNAVSNLLDRIASYFKEPKITLMVRTPGMPASDFVMSSDTLIGIHEVLHRTLIPQMTGEPSVFQHADGDLYLFVSRGKMKALTYVPAPADQQPNRNGDVVGTFQKVWVDSVNYIPVDGDNIMRTTTAERWAERFKPHKETAHD